jgi:hypothetical protein
MMARRTFRYDSISKTFVEVSRDAVSDAPAVHADIDPFVSPVDGTIIESRSQLRDYMGEKGLVHFDEVKDQGPKTDRYQEQRERAQLREQLWEYTDRAIRTGKAQS